MSFTLQEFSERLLEQIHGRIVVHDGRAPAKLKEYITLIPRDSIETKQVGPFLFIQKESLQKQLTDLQRLKDMVRTYQERIIEL